jgi:hypothetical protein
MEVIHLPVDEIHVSGFGGEDTGVMELDLVPQVDAVLCYGWLVQVFQPDIPMFGILQGPELGPFTFHPHISLRTIVMLSCHLPSLSSRYFHQNSVCIYLHVPK